MAAPMIESTFKSFMCPIKELRLDKTLACGQSFRWKENIPGTWVGVLAGRVWKLKQNENEIFYATHGNFMQQPSKIEKRPPTKKHRKLSKKGTTEKMTRTVEEKHIWCENLGNECDNELNILSDYLQLSVKLQDLYAQWSHKDPNFREKSENFQGVRMLRQHPVENLFSFICSSNNHISRISSMVEKLCENYGEKITEIDGQAYFAFPSISSLAGEGVEEKLRQLGFGYRAKYISSSAHYLSENGGEDFLFSLREKPYEEAKQQLMKLNGVGAKVADCVCLMSMDKAGAIPVDTHVWQIASRDYIPKLKQSKSLTDNLYKEIGDHFRSLWGPYAGWAHSVLFTADLKKFKRESPDTDSKIKEKAKKKKVK